MIFNVIDIPGTASEFIVAYFEQQNLAKVSTDHIGEGAGFDYTVSTTRVRALFSRPTPPDEVVFIFRMDSIAQEENETLTLQLHVDPSHIRLPTGRNVFFKSTIRLTILDIDGKD